MNSAPRILVVEDNSLNRELVVDLLEAEGFTVLGAETAEEGIRLALSDAPHLILMDIQLPGMDGLEATRRLHTDPQTAAIPVVALTAHAMRGDEDRALSAGCCGYITKPISTRAFPQAVRDFLAGQPRTESSREPLVEAEADPALASRLLDDLDALFATPPRDVAPPEMTGPILEMLDGDRAEASTAEGPALTVLNPSSRKEDRADPTSGDEAERAGNPSRRKRRASAFTASAPAAARILVVDDNEADRELLVGLLRAQGYEADVVRDGAEALSVTAAHHDLVLMDIALPDMSGAEVCRQLRANKRFADLPVIFVSALDGQDARQSASDAGASDWIDKPVDRAELQIRIATQLRLKRSFDAMKQHQKDLEDAVRTRTNELQRSQALVEASKNRLLDAEREMLQRLAFLAEFREGATAAAHIRCVGEYSAAIAQALGLGDDEAEAIGTAAAVHDIGLLALPESITQARGLRNEYEESVYRTHTSLGARLLSGARGSLLGKAEAIALSHHERWDGKGYPQHLSGEAIPLVGRIVAVADALDLWTAYDHKRRGLDADQARHRLRSEAGTAFDPRVVVAAEAAWDAVETIQRKYRRTEEPPDDLPSSRVAYAV